MKKAVVVALILALLPLGNTAHAEEPLCAAVLPCAEDGSVLEEVPRRSLRIHLPRSMRPLDWKRTWGQACAACIDDATASDAKRAGVEKQLRLVKAKLRAALRARRK